MAWPKPLHSKNKVNRAGQLLIAGPADWEEWAAAYDVLTNWRACHGYPINTFQATLRKKLKKVDADAVVAQRLKRLPSIIIKLKRQKNMNLARMQDIGGVRAVVGTMNQLKPLRDEYADSIFTHTLIGEDDYISKPKPSGYRSIHLIYKYHRAEAPDYNGLLLELQFRTRLQHAWATAVETMGTLLEHSLKSSEGPSAWLEFFSLCSSAFAYIERTPRVAKYEALSKQETFARTIDKSNKLGVPEKLHAFSSAVSSIPGGIQRAAYYLIILDLKQKSVRVESFAREKLDVANQRYTEVEKQVSSGNPIQVVLVSAGSVEALRRAYPNYFLDTRDFLQHINSIKETLNNGFK